MPQIKLVYEEVEVVLLCANCMKGGTIRFRNHTSVGERLKLAAAEHHAVSPGCELDWDKIIVQSAVFYKNDEPVARKDSQLSSI